MSARSFRVSFDPKVSMFKIEIMAFLGFVWTPACCEIGGRAETRYFPTYAEALTAVTDMGLNKIYQDATIEPPWNRSNNHPAGMTSNY